MIAEDLDAIMAVEVRAYSHPWSPGNFADSLQSGYWCQCLPDALGRFMAYFVAMPGVDELHLLNITVAPEHQGLGLGRALLAHLSAQCAAQGLGRLWLEVRQSNQRALALYLRLGFVQAGVRRGYYPMGSKREDALVMRLDIDAQPWPVPTQADQRLNSA